MLITFSPDGNSIPKLIPALVAKMKEGYDMVIASRYLGPARSQDDDWLTAFGNWLFTKTVNLLHGGHYSDVMVILRLSHATDLRPGVGPGEVAPDPEKLFGCRISWEPLLSVRAARRKLKVTEIPGDEPPRVGGERKLQVWRWGAAYYYQFLRETLAWG